VKVFSFNARTTMHESGDGKERKKLERTPDKTEKIKCQIMWGAREKESEANFASVCAHRTSDTLEEEIKKLCL
jgi:GTP cyclohydrolase I